MAEIWNIFRTTEVEAVTGTTSYLDNKWKIGEFMPKLSSKQLILFLSTGWIRFAALAQFRFDYEYFIHVLGLHVLEMENSRGF